MHASRYRCKRLTLVYPASRDCLPGKLTEFVLWTQDRPMLEVIAVDVRELAFGGGVPAGMDGMIPFAGHRKQGASRSLMYEQYEGFRSLLLPQCFHGGSNAKSLPRGRLVST